MDNYNVLVLMEKDPITSEFLDTVLSVRMEEGLENVSKAYVSEESGEFYAFLYLTTPDVEDWEFYGIFEDYEGLGGMLEEYDDYNPAWILKLPYGKDDNENEDMIRNAVKLHYKEYQRLKASIPAKRSDYEAMASEE